MQTLAMSLLVCEKRFFDNGVGLNNSIHHLVSIVGFEAVLKHGYLSSYLVSIILWLQEIA
jgi:hypothetical protein